MKINEIKHFNTGRHYDKRGQLIFYRIEIIEPIEVKCFGGTSEFFPSLTIRFFDVSRGIRQIVSIIIDDDPLINDSNIEYKLLEEYDKCNYIKEFSHEEGLKMMEFEKYVYLLEKTI